MDSGQRGLDIPAILKLNLVICDYISYATLTIVCYEHIVTFHHEYNCLRKSKWNAATWLFLINRYVLLAATVTYAAPWDSKACISFASQVIFAVFMILPSMIIAVFSALRIFAFQEGRCILPGIILLFSLIAVAFNTYFQSKTAMIYIPDITTSGPLCIAFPSMANIFDNYGLLIVPVCLLIADFVAIVATWMKTYHHVRQAASLGIPTVAKILLRDGSLYFLAIFVLTGVQSLGIILSMFNFAEDALFFTKIMPNVLLGRFLINLRQFADHDALTGGQPSIPVHFASVRGGFHNTIVGMAAPLGEPVGYGAEDSCSDSEDNDVAIGLDEAADGRSC